MKYPSSRRGLIALSGLIMAGTTSLVALAPQVQAASTGTTSTYIVLYKSGASSADAASAVSGAGGSLVANYQQIGVVIARSDSSTFASTLKRNGSVQGVSATARFATRNVDNSATDDASPAVSPALSGTDSLSSLQWDMDQIHAAEAHAINTGAGVLVGDLDTGLDFTHPDLAPNYDAANSTDCTSGAPAPLGVGNDVNGHGTHTAGTIAAAANGVGIIGVAPGVRIAGVKAGNDDGFFFPEAVVCGFMWSATHGFAVTNNSYFADPWLFNCRNDAEQRAIWQAEQRAIAYAQKQGVVVVAAEGNESDDLTHPTQDVTSPDDTTPITRDISNACAVVPVEVPGVVGVTAVGDTTLKSFYSSYGISSADVAAPGGDSRTHPNSFNGRVLSTWPAASLTTTCLASRRVVDASGATYCYQQGTSMASPHATGVAALLAAATGLRGPALASALQRATNPIACPTDYSTFAPFPSVSNGAPQVCTGGIGMNSFYGSGEVDALKAVTLP